MPPTAQKRSWKAIAWGVDPAVIRRGEYAVAALISIAALFLHWTFLTHAGGFWRDEAGSVQLAMLPTTRELWQMLPHGGFPAFFPLALRAWASVAPAGDFGLRLLGFGMGVLVLAALWWNARAMGYRLPLLSLSLLAVNVTLIRSGDSMRAYGCGALFMLITIGLLWQLMLAPVWWRFLLATLAGVVSVHCLYQNAILLLAVGCSGALICLRRKQKRTALLVLGAGALAALSLIPYLKPVSEAQRWWMLSKSGLQLDLVGANLSEAAGGPGGCMIVIWLGLFLWLIKAAIGSLQETVRRSPVPAGDIVLFASSAAVIGALGSFIFIGLARLPTQPWQFLPVITFLAACFDAALASRLDRFRVARLVAVFLIVGLQFPRAADQTRYRQTNIDLIASKLNHDVAPGDCIVVHPWYCGVTFGRYYRGPAPWTTLPPLGDYRFHRYDLLKVEMQKEKPIQPVLDQIAATLRAGRRVWLVGPVPISETPPPEMRPAPENPWGWLDGPYSMIWGAQAGNFIANNARKVESVDLATTNRVIWVENLPLIEVSGWRANF